MHRQMERKRGRARTAKPWKHSLMFMFFPTTNIWMENAVSMFYNQSLKTSSLANVSKFVSEIIGQFGWLGITIANHGAVQNPHVNSERLIFKRRYLVNMLQLITYPKRAACVPQQRSRSSNQQPKSSGNLLGWSILQIKKHISCNIWRWNFCFSNSNSTRATAYLFLWENYLHFPDQICEQEQRRKFNDAGLICICLTHKNTWLGLWFACPIKNYYVADILQDRLC